MASSYLEYHLLIRLFRQMGVRLSVAIGFKNHAAKKEDLFTIMQIIEQAHIKIHIQSLYS